MKKITLRKISLVLSLLLLTASLCSCELLENIYREIGLRQNDSSQNAPLQNNKNNNSAQGSADKDISDLFPDLPFGDDTIVDDTDYTVETVGPNGSDTVFDTEKAEDTTTVEKDPIFPPNISFDGRKVLIFSSGTRYYNEFNGDERATRVGAAQVKRKEAIEKQYDIKLSMNYYRFTGNVNAQDGGYNFIKLANLAQEPVAEYATMSVYESAALARDVFLYDINDLPYVNTKNAWWDQNANEELTLNGALYFTIGCATTSQYMATEVLYFNKSYAGEFKDIIYQNVEQGTWTADLFHTYSKAACTGLDQITTPSADGACGFVYHPKSIYAFITASSAKIATPERDDCTLSLTYEKGLAYNMIAKLENTANDSALSSAALGQAKIAQMLKKGNVLFYSASSADAQEISDLRDSYGIIPYPKHDINQDRYYSTLDISNAQMICVPNVHENAELSGVVLESMAYYGADIVWPEVYEHCASDKESRRCLDIIFSSYSHDYGAYYNISGFYSDIINMQKPSREELKKIYNAHFDEMTKELKDLSARYVKLKEFQ